MQYHNDHFICRKNQSIPKIFANDSIPDCIDGIDEPLKIQPASGQTCQDITFIPCFPGDNKCLGQFKCHRSVICVDINNTCDEEPDCIHGDDEYFCLSELSMCPSGCGCLQQKDNKLLKNDKYIYSLLIYQMDRKK